MYIVRGLTSATAATADHAVFGIWNGHSTQRIKLIQWSIFCTAAVTAGQSIRWRRTTARGTVGSSVTPDIDNHSERAIAPVSGYTLDLGAYSAQPTLDASELGIGWVAAAFAASGGVFAIPGGIVVPPGTGLVAIQRAANAWPISECSVVTLEDW